MRGDQTKDERAKELKSSDCGVQSPASGNKQDAERGQTVNNIPVQNRAIVKIGRNQPTKVINQQILIQPTSLRTENPTAHHPPQGKLQTRKARNINKAPAIALGNNRVEDLHPQRVEKQIRANNCNDEKVIIAA